MKLSHPGGAIRLSARREGASAVIGVKDACGGLDPATMHKLFEPFVQAGIDRSGFGLGLAIVRQATEAHGGALEVQNLPGEGCVFRLTLPVKEQA
ncbi:MAG: HAMP domain-containing sensor histidine kinase [Polyangiales bacterium]